MNKSPKLLLIGSSNGNAHLSNYYELIKNEFDEIHVITNKTISYSQHELLEFGLRNPFQFIKNIKKLTRIISKFKPSIIHVHQANSYALMAILANRSKIPLVLTTWGSDVLLLPQKGFLHRAMVRYVLKKATVITADAHFMADAIHELIGKKEVIIANFGVEFQKNNEVIAREFIIYSNRMHEPLYNIDQLIYQLKDFLLENSKWKLIIAAEGTQTPYLKKIVAEEFPRNTIEFVGFLSPKENILYYKKAMLYISIPKSDGTSISLLEAMAYGCMPITSDLPANKEWITTLENGIVSHGNLTKDVELALELDRVAIQEKNKEIIESRATKETNKRLFSAIYDKLKGPI
jgi:glycosyltransferase involved in cell wall biosynthesis